MVAGGRQVLLVADGRKVVVGKRCVTGLLHECRLAENVPVFKQLHFNVA